MSWFDKLERKMGKYAINNLMYYIIAIYAMGFVVAVFFPAVYSTYLALDAEAILHGQIWRIFTFILQPPSTSFLFLFFVLYFYYMIGTVLERLWGAFRFNLYFFSGMLLHVIAAIVIYLIFGVNYHMGTEYINLALFMAFAFENPDNEVLLFFVLPIKIKWLAYLDAVIFGITIIGGYCVSLLPQNVWFGLYQLGFLAGNYFTCYVMATAALVSMANFIIFMLLFNKHRRYSSQTQKNFRKAVRTAKRAEKNRQEGRKPSFNEKFYNANSSKSSWESANKTVHKTGTSVTKHKCAVCGRTENDGDELVFRYCSKCNGNLEYCQEHLYTHIHVTK
ncbi:MAG: hypothetical protein Q4F11_03685 [Eubacteriales bacterium]|nr:hypothetical protein [Eubacteriales bacterium]